MPLTPLEFSTKECILPAVVLHMAKLLFRKYFFSGSTFYGNTSFKKYLDNDEIVFIDLQKTFDTVNHKVEKLEKLKHYGIRSKENNWFHSFLTNRKQYVSINGFFSQTKIVRCGVPQGSTWGRLLFLIYINNLNNALHKCRAHHLLFGLLVLLVFSNHI